MRIATIDIGTNTTLLLVAEKDGGELRAVREIATITRLGQGVDETRRLHPEAVKRTLDCLEGYAAVTRELGVAKVAIVGTSAMRDAGGSDAMRARIEALFDVAPQVISGPREAELTGRGALSGLATKGPALVFDIGGGSTECIALDGERRVTDLVSVDVGSVRLTERAKPSDPPTRAELDAMSATARSLCGGFAGIRRAYREVLDGTEPPVGVAGTMTTLAAVSLRMDTYDGSRVHGHRMTRAEVARVVDELARMPLAERKSVPGLEPKRADVIVAGGLVALACLDELEAEAVIVSDRGVRWGLAEELIS
jgi:exopolyphosphatase/guanosine-5'-triphosphate,3'-diphosphate pyrophosphatase